MAAEASECAGEQDSFWEYHDFLFNNQSGKNRSSFNKDNLKRFASELGLDTDKFNECVDTRKFATLIQEDYLLSQKAGVNSTPTFLLNGRLIFGAQPFEAFQQYILMALSEQE